MEGYKKRMVKEYQELKSKYDKLDDIVTDYEAGVLAFKLNCPIELLKEQKYHMGMYLHALKVRAKIDGVSLR